MPDRGFWVRALSKPARDWGFEWSTIYLIARAVSWDMQRKLTSKFLLERAVLTRI